MDVALANIAVQFLHLRSWWYGNGCKWGCVWNIIKTIIETHQMPGTRWNTDKDKAIWNAFSTTAPFYLKFHKSKGLSLVAASINIEKHDVPASPRLNYLLWEPSRDCASGIMGAPGEGCTVHHAQTDWAPRHSIWNPLIIITWPIQRNPKLKSLAPVLCRGNL